MFMSDKISASSRIVHKFFVDLMVLINLGISFDLTIKYFMSGALKSIFISFKRGLDLVFASIFYVVFLLNGGF